MIELTDKLLLAFIAGGGVCLVGQMLFDLVKLSPAHTMCFLVSTGSLLSGFGVYDGLIDRFGMGFALPIVSFGNSLQNGAAAGLREHGFWGVFSGMYGPVSAGIAAAVVFAVLAAIFFKPKY